MNSNDRVFIISKEKSKQFLEDRKKNVISPEFLERSLDYNRLFGKKKRIVSMEDGLEDIEIINWSEDVLSGKKRVEICGCEHDFIRMQYADEEFKCTKCGVNRDDLGWISRLCEEQ